MPMQRSERMKHENAGTWEDWGDRETMPGAAGSQSHLHTRCTLKALKPTIAQPHPKDSDYPGLGWGLKSVSA